MIEIALVWTIVLLIGLIVLCASTYDTVKNLMVYLSKINEYIQELIHILKEDKDV